MQVGARVFLKPVRARTEGRAPADIRDELLPKLLSGEVRTKVAEERL
jgi:hypothetical protein